MSGDSDPAVWTIANPDVPIGAIQTLVITGRGPPWRRPWYVKLNPVWWLGNHGDPLPPADYDPGRPLWWRTAMWYLRNPLVNFSDFVLGVCDRNYFAWGVAPIRTTAWNDLPEPWRYGFKWTVIDFGLLRLPFVSYVGQHWMFYAGWQVNGNIGFKLNRITRTK